LEKTTKSFVAAKQHLTSWIGWER